MEIASSNGAVNVVRLPDHGAFELDPEELVAAMPTDELTFTLTRWDLSSLETNGAVVDVVATSRAAFTASFADVGRRSEITASETCEEVQSDRPLSTGIYWGNLGDYGADRQPSCVEPGCAFGNDGLFLVEVPPRHHFQVEYNVFTDSASMYLQVDCRSDTCEGSDTDPNANVPSTCHTLIQPTICNGSTWALTRAEALTAPTRVGPWRAISPST